MNILYLNIDRGIPVLGDKGASVHVRSFITAAARLGHRTMLACTTLGAGNAPPPAEIIELPPSMDEATLLAECAMQAVPHDLLAQQVTRLEIARLAHDRALQTRLLDALRRTGFRPDLMYERHALFSTAGVGIARHLGIPRLLEVNAPLIDEQRNFRDLRLIDAARRAETTSYRGADAIVAVSAAVAASVRAVAGNGVKVHVIPNGVELARFGAGANGAAIRKRLGIGTGTIPVIGFIGSFKPWHGVHRLFDAFIALAPSTVPAILIAVGDGPDLAALRVRAAACGCADRIILPGRVPHVEIPEWLAAMDLTVAPYNAQDDFYFSPLKIVESMAAGRPVIAPALGQISDLIDHDVTGLLYAPGDLAALRKALEALIADPERTRAMGRQARRATEGWDWTAVVNKALALVPQHVMGEAS